MGRTVSTRIFLGCAALALCCSPAGAEWAQQTLKLDPGWNAVFFEVTPDDNSCDAVFGGLPIESVWHWNKRFDPQQFVRNPSELVPELPDWITYFPSDSPKSFLTSLHAVHSGQAYLVQVYGEESVTLSLTGQLALKTYDWIPDALNLVGFHVNPNEPPSFSRFLGGNKALAGQEVYRISSEGLAEPVGDLDTATIERGEAYWVYCDGETGFTAPLEVEYAYLDGIQFDRRVDEQPLDFTNETDEAKRVTIALVSAAAPQSKNKNADLPVLAGDVKLAYQNRLNWENLDKPMSFVMPPQSTQRVTLGVRRADMPSAGDGVSWYASVLEVTDTQGTYYRLPVSAEKISTDGGLWAGTVTVSKVSETGNTENPDVPTTAAGEFDFRLLVHIDESGAAKLLQRVTMMQVQEVLDDDSNVTEPSRYVLITDEGLISQYTGVAIRDGAVIGRRLTSPVFAFDDPIDMTEPEDDVLEAEVTMAYDDLKNPFVHPFHPDHDNLDERFDETLPAGFESWDFSRTVRLEFSEQDPEALNLPAWGYSLIGGTYRETISGVHNVDIVVEGTFQLTRVSDVTELNDGQ